MNMNKIKEIARQRGVKPGKLRKVELVRAIQLAEDNPQCFNTSFSGTCGEPECLWRDDCD